MITYDTPLREIPRPANAVDIRRVVVANALSVVDLDASDKRTRPVLEALLGPVVGRWDLDRPFRCYVDAHGRERTEGVSTCGLVAEGLWRRAGVDAPWLRTQYGFGGIFDSIERARVFAQRLRPHPAWHVPGEGRPSAGDYVVIGTGKGTHALTVLRWDADDLVSCDGGQTGPTGLQAIHVCNRPWLDSVRGSSALGARAVVGWIDVTMLPGLATCLAPAGWEAVEV